jgi:hypothetical protein
MILSDLEKQVSLLCEITSYTWKLSKNNRHYGLVKIVRKEDNRGRENLEYVEVNISPFFPLNRLHDWIDAFIVSIIHQRNDIKSEGSVKIRQEGQIYIVEIIEDGDRTTSGRIKRLNGRRWAYDQAKTQSMDIFLTERQMQKIAEFIEELNRKELLPRA